MAGEVALRLLLKGQREVSAGLASVTKETGALGKAAEKAAVGAKSLSGGLDSVQKQGIGAVRTSKAYLVALNKVADAEQAAAAAATKAAELRTKAVTALADATAKQAAGDLEGARAAQASADAFNAQATAARRGVVALNAHTSAARANLRAVSSAATASAAAGGGGVSGRTAAFGALSSVGGAVTKAGLATGAYMAYEGVKRMGSFQDQVTRLATLANVPRSQLPALQNWMVSNSVGLREDPGTLATQMYRIASASPGKSYNSRTLEKLTRAAAMFSVIGGPGTDPEQAARIFGIIRANGGLGTKNYRQIGGVAAATIGSGDMTASDYISALGTGGLAVNAARHKISLTQLGGVLAEMGDLGVTGSTAGTRVQHAISLLASPTSAAAKIYAQIGLSPTMIDQVIRTKGLGAGLRLLHRQMTATMPANKIGQTASVAQLMGVGYSRPQAQRMQKSGTASMEDLMLTHMFGGARQSVPIIALYDSLTRTGGKTAEVARQGSPASFNRKFGAASKTPAQEWKRFDLDLQHVENTIGLNLIPKLISLFDWVSRNKGALEETAKIIGIAAIPAIGAYAASLAMRAVGAVSKFTGALRGQNTELAKTGGIAGAQSRGMGIMGSAVMGLTTAVGVWELGNATGSHGAGGALTAGLGGAVAGMMAGLAIGGPFGAAVGAAGGALVGLAGHFWNVSNQVSAATQNMRAFDQQLSGGYASDKYKLGASSNQSILGYLKTRPGAASALAASGVRLGGIDKFLRSGGQLNVGAAAQLQQAQQAGRITAAQEQIGINALLDISANFGATVRSLSDIATLSGQTSQFAQDQAQQSADAVNKLILGPLHGHGHGHGTHGGGGGKRKPGGNTAINKVLGSDSGGHSRSHATGDLHVHLNVDKKELAHAVVGHFRDQQARQ